MFRCRRRTVIARSLDVLIVGGLVLAACGGSDDDRGDEDGDEQVAPAVDAGPIPARPPLSVSSTWHWQLQGDLDTSVDVDLLESTADVIDDLRRDGCFMICYFSAGSYEPWRPDADGYAQADLGEVLAGLRTNAGSTSAATPSAA